MKYSRILQVETWIEDRKKCIFMFMVGNLKLIFAAAGLLLAMAFTFSCSSGGDDDGGSSSSGGGSSSSDGSHGSFTYEGKEYKTVKIGTQNWMADNLNYAANGSKCYDDDPANCAEYGRLYNWALAKTVCPGGWHLPSASDWDILMEYVQTDNESDYVPGYAASVAGQYLKAASGWDNRGNGENKYDFTALPGGYGDSDGTFSLGALGYWWSSRELDSDSAYYRYMSYSNDYTFWEVAEKSNLYSVRCVQD
jgi:uncharacterized protein (TIGR02145 family)